MEKNQAFEQFVADYQDLVFATAYRLVAKHPEAEDISQEVFLKAFAHFDNLVGKPGAGGWLKTVTTHLSLNHLARYRHRWLFFSEIAEESDDTPELAQPSETSLSSWDLDRLDQLDWAMQRLTPEYRVPLVLYYFDEMPCEAIAGLLNISLGKTKTSLRRGRLKLRQLLEKTPDDGTGRPLSWPMHPMQSWKPWLPARPLTLWEGGAA